MNPLLTALLEVVDHAVVLLKTEGRSIVLMNEAFRTAASAAGDSHEQLVDWALCTAPEDRSFDAGLTGDRGEANRTHRRLGERVVAWRHAEVEGELYCVLMIREPRASVDASTVTYDFLTGLPDRRSFEAELEQRFSDSESKFALLFVDLNGFKQVNDSLGHVAGDRTLREVAQKFRSTLRDGDLIARFGGDEFVVLVDGVARREDVGPIIQRLRESIPEPNSRDHSPEISASIGAALSTDAYPTPEAMLQAADRRMYAHKRAATKLD